MIQIEAGTQDTSKPTVLIENLFASGTLTASSEATDAEGANAAYEGTFDFWTPSAMPATLETDLGAAATANCLGIAAHNLGSLSATVTLETWNGATWDAGPSISPDDDSTILILFPDDAATKWRLNVSGASAPSIGYVALGRRLVLPGIVGEYTPTDWGERIEVLSGRSLSGQFLPARELSFGAETTINLGRVDRAWHSAVGRAFQNHYNRGRSFFFAGWPDTLENDVGLCRRPESARELQAQISFGRFASMSFDVECFVPANLTILPDYDYVPTNTPSSFADGDWAVSQV